MGSDFGSNIKSISEPKKVKESIVELDMINP
jgi:hypothetical protein